MVDLNRKLSYYDTPEMIFAKCNVKGSPLMLIFLRHGVDG